MILHSNNLQYKEKHNNTAKPASNYWHNITYTVCMNSPQLVSMQELIIWSISWLKMTLL